MPEDHSSQKRATKWTRWVARIWSIPILIFALIMFVGYTWSWITTGVADPHAVEDVPLVDALPPILMFLSALGLGVAWRWERLGGAITVVSLLAVLVLLLIQMPITRDFPWSAVPYLMALIIAIPGVLFLVYWRRSRQGNL
jgi:hypothetical protein